MRLRPTVRGVGLAIGGVIAVLAGVAVGAVDLVRIGTLAVLLVVGALVGIGLLDPGRGRHRLAVERGASPNPVHAGSTSVVGVVITATDASGRARLAGLRFREQASAELSGGRPLRAQVARAPGRVTITYPVLAARRGRWTLGPLVVTRVDPFGVATATTSLGKGSRISVWPTVTELQVPPGVLVGDPDRVALGARSPSTDDASLRDYRFGDDLRRVHWATSARRGELMVRSDERAGMRPVSVLLDLPTRSASLEWSISLAASMTLAMLDAGHPVRLLCGPAPAAVAARHDAALTDRPMSVRHAHNRPGDMARADILDRAIDLTIAESPAKADERLLADARVLVASDDVGEIVLAVVGPLTARTRTALARVADKAQGWAVVRSGEGGHAQRGDAESTVTALQPSRWWAVTAEPGVDIARSWMRRLERAL
ncbi:MAG: DUF58 domain-containing protein [Cellulomonas sp.]|uniref:DUF58 domain-containing protein n=1 Tax=Cellulomonas sp. TaxID=40001 RepID=UPI0018370B93|nr:DUF58 domain-containing protein [Cellulomonas sp.]NMM32161.1 DUF58 domain-containing protein [Cellulomonas sp.]